MRRLVLTLAALAMTAGLGACDRLSGGDSDKVFGQKVRAYLLAHPEVLREAINKLQAKEEEEQARADAADMTKARALLPQVRARLEHDPRDFVANPGGHVTVTEFYDYRCPHCVSIAPKVVALIRTHPDVRFVFKEMPIFGPTSEHAARAALAAKTQGKDYVGLFEAMMQARPLNDEPIDRLAKAHGVDTQAMLRPDAVAAANAQISDVAALASQLAIRGTPGFIIGDVIIPGEDMDGVEAAIVKAGGKI